MRVALAVAVWVAWIALMVATGLPWPAIALSVVGVALIVSYFAGLRWPRRRREP